MIDQAHQEEKGQSLPYPKAQSPEFLSWGQDSDGLKRAIEHLVQPHAALVPRQMRGRGLWHLDLPRTDRI